MRGLLGLIVTIGTIGSIQSGSKQPDYTDQSQEILPWVPPVPEVPEHAKNEVRVVRRYQAITSWYRHGRVTANGEPYNPEGLTVAHKTLPFNTIIRMTNPVNGLSVILRVNDRGPFIRGREYDISLGAARVLDIVEIGIARLNVEILK
jgi:rare lipoprotein A